MIRTSRALLPYLVAVAAIVAGLLWYLGDFVSKPELGRTETTGVAAIGGPFRLTDQNGATRADTDFRGRFMLVYFGYTNCPDVCPTTLAVIADALGRMGGDAGRVVPIFITIDPARDTPAMLKTYLRSFGSNFVGLTGSEASIAQATHEYRVYAEKRPLKGGGYSMDHSSDIYLMGPDGKFIANFDETYGPDGLAKAIEKQL